MNRIIASATAATALLVASQLTQAMSLGLSPTEPDIKSAVTIDYTSGVFTATGISPFYVFLDADIFEDMTITGSYVISGSITPAGDVSGTVTLSGTLEDSGGLLASGTLLTGTLTKFGFTDTTLVDNFEFLFDVDSVDSHIPMGSKGGILITTRVGTSTFAGDLEANFAATADADTFAVAVPTPAAASAGLALLGGLAAFRRGRAFRV